MKTSEIRKAFLDFFKAKAHAHERSSSLVPTDDPTLLYTTAGMVQFKSYFAWTVTPPYLRVATVQKCLRAGGKGSDLENVGRTSRHHTFFEMLGNFTFGDYFKKESIAWAWEFVTQVIKLPKEKLWASIYLDDDESFAFWNKDAGLPAQRIVRLGKADNFWGPAGDSGACGPCSEIYIDLGPKRATIGWEATPCTNPDCKPGCDCDRYLEFWNLVFNQFFQEPNGTQRPLPKTGIDTGMGLERLAMIVQGCDSVYETDCFLPVLAQVWAQRGAEGTAKADQTNPLTIEAYRALPRATKVALNVVVDHVRALTFAIADGATPSNEGRGYVLRRILRRAVRFAKTIGLEQSFMYRLVHTIVTQYSEAYPELVDRREHVTATIKAEEESFHSTLRRGMDLLMEFIDELKTTKQTVLTGDKVFFLADTHGFPLDLTREMLEEKGFSLDEPVFEKLMAQQKTTSKKSSKFGTAGQIDEGLDIAVVKHFAGPFAGYDSTTSRHVLNTQAAMAILSGPDAEGLVRFALDPTPFYPESGGQVGDRGKITHEAFEIDVLDTRKMGDHIVHLGRLLKGGDALGRLTAPMGVRAIVDRSWRYRTARHHTATHLLQAALRRIVGKHVGQAGSLVGPDRFRFDFTHNQLLAPDVLRAIETEVNDVILENIPVRCSEMGYKEAIAAGALAFFGDKYGDRVRVVKVAEYSTELCGGTHVNATGEIGLFTILSDASVAAGTRRMEVVCGTEARAHVNRVMAELDSAADTMKVPAAQLTKRLESLLEREKELSRKVKSLQDKLVSGAGAQGPTVQTVDGISFVAQDLGDVDMDACRSGADRILKGMGGSGVVVVGSRDGDKALLVAKLSDDLAGKRLKAGEIIKSIAQIVGGSGGGRPDMASAGGKNPEKLAEALAMVPSVLHDLLARSA